MNKLPARCRECARERQTNTNVNCRFCVDTSFDGAILCDLNRSVQERNDFLDCHAFMPALHIAGNGTSDVSKEAITPDMPNILAERLSAIQFMKSDKMQYQKALALQQLDRDPSGIFCNLKFHFAWNVRGRRPLLRNYEPYLEHIQNAFLSKSISSAESAQLLWMAPDHVHVYCESDGEHSPEAIAVALKSQMYSALASSERIESIATSAEELWDESYFVESIG
ncbi:MAG: transposase [Deltaproteobacteria bacterium]|nr:transposase [Deltaproteobacteria bacterium]